MKSKDFILTRKYVKPMPLIGKRNIMRGSTSVVEMVDLIFYPMKIKSVPDDIEVSHLIIDGYIVPAVDYSKEKVIKVDVGIVEVTIKPGDDGEFGTEDDEVKLSKKVIEEKVEEVIEEVVEKVVEEKIEERVEVEKVEEVVKVEEKIEEKVIEEKVENVEDEMPKRKIGRPKKDVEDKPKRKRVYKRKKKQG